MSKDADILSALVPDRSPESSGYDPEEPVSAPDPSHHWIAGGRWSQCRICGVRAHWPAAQRRCGVRSRRKGPGVPLGEWLEELVADAQRFRTWWLEHFPDRVVPTVPEWWAEFWEWRRG